LSKFPEPPDPESLASISPEKKVLGAGTILWRIYFQSGKHPTSWNRFRDFGPTTARFDHQLAPARRQSRKILYAAENGPTCFAEVFQETRVIDRARSTPWLVAFALGRAVTLLDLTGAWPTRAGASTAIQGLWYCSSMDANRVAVALYERAGSAVPARPVFHRALSDAALATPIARAAVRFGYAVV